MEPPVAVSTTSQYTSHSQPMSAATPHATSPTLASSSSICLASTGTVWRPYAWLTTFAPGVSEIDRAELTAISGTGVAPPRIQECPRHFECRVEWTKEWAGRLMVVGAVVAASVDADCVDADGYFSGTRQLPPTTAGHPMVESSSASAMSSRSTCPMTVPKWRSFLPANERCSRNLRVVSGVNVVNVHGCR